MKSRIHLIVATLLPVLGGMVIAANLFAEPSKESSPMATTTPTESVRIPNVPGLSWGQSGETTFCGTLAVALSVTDTKIDYPTLMGYSALAFRMRWFQGTVPGGIKWCPSSPVGEFPEEHERLAKAIGYPTAGYWDIAGEDANFIRHVPQVIAELKAGRPVISYDSILNCNLLIGYRQTGDQTIFLSYDYFHGDKVVEIPAAKLRVLDILGQRRQPMPRRNAILIGLRGGVTNWSRDGKTDAANPDKAKGYYALGYRAYDAWIADIKSMDTAAEPDRKECFLPNWWTFDSLVDARVAAAQFLRAAAPEFAADARGHLLKAADIYDQFVKSTAICFENKDAFLGPWTGKSLADWTPENRAREVAILTSARTLDEQAIAEIDAAVNIEDGR